MNPDPPPPVPIEQGPLYDRKAAGDTTKIRRRGKRTKKTDNSDTDTKPKRGRGRPSTRDASGLTAAQRAALAFKRENPSASRVRTAEAIGINPDSLKNWLDPKHERFGAEFKHRWVMYSPGESQKVPPVPDFITFRREYLGIDIENPHTLRRQNTGVTWPYMEPFCKALDDVSIRRVLCLWPVFHAKSAIVEHFIIWQLCRKPDSRIILICSNLDLAQERVLAVQQILESPDIYETLHSTWGPWIGKADGRPWHAKGFYVSGRTMGHRSPSVQAFGISSKVYGRRGDVVILDDIDDPDFSEDIKRKILKKVAGPISTRLSEGGRMIYVGTRTAQVDVAGTLIDGGQWWTDVRKAIQDDGSVLCPEMYSKEELDHMAAGMDEQDVSLFFQNDPIGTSDQMFSADVVHQGRGEFKIGEAPDDWQRMMILDPAARGVAAVTTIAYKESQLRIVDSTAKRNPAYQGIYEMLVAHIYRHKPTYCVIEESGATFLTDYPAIGALLHEFGIELIRFNTNRNKVDPRLGMGLVKSQLQLGLLKYAWADDEAQRVMNPLVNEMLTWRPTTRTNPKDHHWDRMMTVWMGVNSIVTRAWDSMRSRHKIADPLRLRRRRRVGV